MTAGALVALTHRSPVVFVCRTHAVTTQRELKDGGGFAKVAWSDTEGTFTAKRIVKIAEMTWMQVEEYLKTDDRCVLPLGSTEQHAYATDVVASLVAHVKCRFGEEGRPLALRDQGRRGDRWESDARSAGGV